MASSRPPRRICSVHASVDGVIASLVTHDTLRHKASDGTRDRKVPELTVGCRCRIVQIPLYQAQPFWMLPLVPPSSNVSVTTIRRTYFMLLEPIWRSTRSRT